MKKLLKVGCLVIVGLVILITLIGLLVTDGDQENSENSENIDQMDSPESKESLQPVLTDSIWQTLVPNNFREEVNEFEQNAFYYHPLSPKYVNRNWIFTYIGKNENSVWLRLKLQYEADDWLFIKKVQFLIDGEPIDFASGAFKRDNNSGRIWEWADLEVGPGSIKSLMSIADSKETKVRYTGSKYYKDRVLTKREKTALKDMLELYLKAREYRLE